MIDLRGDQVGAIGGSARCKEAASDGAGAARAAAGGSGAPSSTAGVGAAGAAGGPGADAPGAGPVGPSVVSLDPSKPDWIGIALGDASGAPVPGAAWEVTLPDGEVVEGRLDASGRTRLEGVDPGECTVRFPELDRRGFR